MEKLKIFTIKEKDYGNKINNLIKLNNHLKKEKIKNIKVPKSLVISNDFYEIYKQVGRKNNISNLCKKIKSYFQKENQIIIRTSTNYEDLRRFTGAGLFFSLAISNSYESIFDTVNNIYKKFTFINSEYKGIKLNLLIQKLIKGEGGVLVTYDFINKDKKHLIVSISKEGPEGITSGKDKGCLYLINKENKNIITLEKEGNISIDNKIKKFIQLSLIIESIFGHKQEVEFVYNNKTLYVLQVRDFVL